MLAALLQASKKQASVEEPVGQVKVDFRWQRATPRACVRWWFRLAEIPASVRFRDE
jgi:hypothetical protein